MAISLAMLDVDGTLMHRERWNPGALELIGHLADSGMQVALCSGRPTGSLITLAQQVPQVSMIASSSGATALVRDPLTREETWRVLGHRALEPDLVVQALVLADQAGIETWAYNDRQWLVRSISAKVRDEETFIGDVPVLDPIVGRMDVGKVLFILRNSEQLELAKTFAGWEGAGVVLSADAFADLVPEVATFTKGGDLLIDHLEIGWDDVLALGDGENDIGMLSRAGSSIAIAPLSQEAVPGSGGRRANAATTEQALEIVRGWL